MNSPTIPTNSPRKKAQPLDLNQSSGRTANTYPIPSPATASSNPVATPEAKTPRRSEMPDLPPLPKTPMELQRPADEGLASGSDRVDALRSHSSRRPRSMEVVSPTRASVRSASPRRNEPSLTPRVNAGNVPSVRFASVTVMPTPGGASHPATTTSTAMTTTSATVTTTTEFTSAIFTTAQTVPPQGSPKPAKSPRSPVPPLALDSPGSRIRTGSSPARLNHSPDSLGAETPPMQATPASPRTLVARQRSNGLERDFTIVRKMKAPPYPPLAAQWIDEANYHRMDREAQIMIIGFAAVRSLYESAEREFGENWTWSQTGRMPMRDWAQKGNFKESSELDDHYFDSQAAFLSAYREGRLAGHLAGALIQAESEYAQSKNSDVIVKLAQQADHVLVLAMRSIRNLSRCTDVTPANRRSVWNAVTTAHPTPFQLGELRAFFSESFCIAFQAFIHASVSLLSEVAKHCTSEDGGPGASVMELMATFYFVCAYTLGEEFGDLQIMFDKLQQDQFEAPLNAIGLSTQSLKAILDALGKKEREALKNIVDVQACAKKLHEREERQTSASTNAMARESKVALTRLAQGDRRFLDAWGLPGITGATPSSLSIVDKLSGNSSSSPLIRTSTAQSPRDRLNERRRSEGSPVKRILTADRGARTAQANPPSSPRPAPGTPRPQNSPAPTGEANIAAPSPLKRQQDQ